MGYCHPDEIATPLLDHQSCFPQDLASSVIWWVQNQWKSFVNDQRDKKQMRDWKKLKNSHQNSKKL